MASDNNSTAILVRDRLQNGPSETVEIRRDWENLLVQFYAENAFKSVSIIKSQEYMDNYAITLLLSVDKTDGSIYPTFMIIVQNGENTLELTVTPRETSGVDEDTCLQIDTAGENGAELIRSTINNPNIELSASDVLSNIGQIAQSLANHFSMTVYQSVDITQYENATPKTNIKDLLSDLGYEVQDRLGIADKRFIPQVDDVI